MDEHFVAAGGRHQAAIQWVLLVFQNGMNHLLAAGLMRQGCDYHLSEQQKAIPVRCLKPPGSEETRPQSTWFWKPSERTVWATPNRLPLAQAVTQSCEKVRHRQGSPGLPVQQVFVRRRMTTVPDATGPQSPIAIPGKIPTSGRLDSGCSQLIDLPEALQIRIAQSESSCSSREFVSSRQALRKRVPRAPGFGNHLRGQFGQPPTDCHWPRQ